MPAEPDRAPLAAELKARALALGFDRAGIAAAQPSAFAAEFDAWLSGGNAADMHWLARDTGRRTDPRRALPGARSVLCVALNYYVDADEGPGTPPPDPDRAVFARYARGDDYHEVMLPRLRSLCHWLDAAVPGSESRAWVDTGPLLERELAQRAGLGWFGKNTMLIDTRSGSYFLLGEVVTTADLAPDTPSEGGCGTCTACLDACPTGALFEPYRLDARRCISYLTIERKEPEPDPIQTSLGDAANRVFGCDICQEVCPFNLRRAAPVSRPEFEARPFVRDATVESVLALTPEAYRAAFKGSAVKRAKLSGLQRNAAAARS